MERRAGEDIASITVFWLCRSETFRVLLMYIGRIRILIIVVELLIEDVITFLAELVSLDGELC